MNNNSDKRQDQNSEENDGLQIYGPGGSTLQTPEEHQHDQQVDPRKDSTIAVSNDDLHTTDIEKLQNELDGEHGDQPEIDDRLSNEK